ncbi:MAG TPA: InlB B-repeat-containing protein [Spirochaetales bacterium]|nr:InlB B-repeat-containing protein [Spirochaetales bacterium]
MKKNHKLALLIGLMGIGVLVLSACTIVITGGARVFYDANYATEGTPPVDTRVYSYGSTATVLDNIGNLQKSGCVFVGWNTNADGSGTWYFPGDPLDIDLDSSIVILYAQWMPRTAISGTWQLTYQWDNMSQAATARWYIYSNGTFADDSNGRGTWDISGNTVEFHYTNGAYYVFDFANTNYLSSDNHWGSMKGTMSGYDNLGVLRVGTWSATQLSNIVTSMAKSILQPGTITPSGEVVK